MDQYLDNRQKEILWALLANPADNDATHTQTLQRLVNDHPQSGLLQALLARTGQQQQLSSAAAYFNPRVLHKLVHHPEDLAVVPAGKVAGIRSATNENRFSIPVLPEEPENVTEPEPILSGAQTDEIIPAPESASPLNEGPVADITEPAYAEADAEAEVETPSFNAVADDIAATDTPPPVPEPVQQFDQGIENPAEANLPAEPDNRDAELSVTEMPVVHHAPEEEENKKDETQVNEPEPAEPKEEVYFRQDIDDEIYEEIVSIEDIGFEAITASKPEEPVVENYLHEPQYEEGTVDGDETFAQPAPDAEEEKLILGNIVGSDYLLFDKKLDELRANAPAAEQPTQELDDEQSQAPTVSESKDISRYNDDKMPYTFMWWLDKTRKEHAGSLQPYASDTLSTPAAATEQPAAALQNKSAPIERAEKLNTADELQQQYYENIFSLTSVSGIEKENEVKAVEFDHSKKEDVIIERFIHNEPQIKPLAADKLDNENKAKKSSEDQDALVTETLARIYIDQMLYHKAIATYKKLILKYPEKKLYFAAQIEQLEKRTN